MSSAGGGEPDGGSADFDDTRRLVDWISHFAAATPDAPALVCDQRVTTYAELDRRAGAVADALGTHPGEPVAALVGHDDHGLVALLGVMRSGRPLVPLDPLIPTARLATMFELSRATTILTDDKHRLVVDSLGVAGDAVLELDFSADHEPPPAADASTGTASTGTFAPDPYDVSCVFFTSGSTGLPKGVAWSHRMLACEAWSGVAPMGFGPGDRMALVLPFSFSAGMGVVAWALSSGAALHVFDPRQRPVSELRGWLADHRVTTMHSTPSLMRSLLTSMAPDEVLPELRIVMTCAEPVHGTEVAELRRHLGPTASYVNWTGASEIGTLALNRVTASEALPDGVVPTGRPVPLKTVEIRTPGGELAAADEAGEVTVVSRYVADGYWHDEQRSAVKFERVDDKRRRYRMGDLGRVSAAGVLELLGRVDNAVKIRGYLVEPIEVEAAMLALDDVTDAVVIGEKRPGAPTRLIAYVACPPASRISPASIRRQLGRTLPDWMIPSVVVQLARLPRTERGKVDRQALPPAPAGPRAGYVAPRTPWEIAVSDIWSRALQLHEVGVHDDFAELGGDSLVAEEILTLTDAELDFRPPSAALIEAPTVAEFAALVEHANSVAGRAGEPGAGPRSQPWAEDATVVPLKTSGTKPPLFCFAGAGGLALTFLPLVRRLGDDQPAWGLQERGLERRGFVDWSVGGTAKRHLRAIRTLQPTGPYVLVGYSFGGLVAYEVARRLTAAGERVSLLVTLDTVLPGTVFNANRGAHGLGTEHAGPAAVPPQRTARTARAGSGADASVAAPADTVSRFNLVARARRSERPLVMILCKIHLLPLVGLVRFAGTNHYDVFFRKGMLASQYYRIRGWAGRTLVVVARDNSEEVDNRGWRGLLTGEWRMEYVAGDHHSMWREPNVNEVAALLREEIAASRSRGTTGSPGQPVSIR